MRTKKLSPADLVRARALYADALFRSGDVSAALDALGRNPTRKNAEHYAKANFMAGRLDAGLELSKIAGVRPTSTLLRICGDECLDRGDYMDGKRAYRLAKLDLPDDMRFYRCVGKVAEQGLVDVLEKMYADRGERPPLHYRFMAADALVANGDLRGLRLLKKLRRRPTRLAAQEGALEILGANSGRADDAVRLLRAAGVSPRKFLRDRVLQLARDGQQVAAIYASELAIQF